jgi:branched-chain amino acid transport system permease protein
MGTAKFWVVSFIVAIAFLVLTRWLFTNEYYFFAAYQVLQFIVLATAWNILGGYTGYTNFGTGAFFAVGAYTAVVLHKLTSLPVPVMMLVGGVMSGIVGFGMGYLTLRLKGVFFAIATLALAIVAQTLIVNWDFVGGSRGIYVIRPQRSPIYGSYIQYLYSLMLALTWVSVAIARTIEGSRLGLGFNAIRDDELAAEAGGVPTLRLKLIATTLSGALMGMSGAPLPYYVTYLDPASSFNLSYAVNSVAMPLIGGMTSWIGPIIGAVLLGTIQQLATVTISSALNLLIVGVLLIVFVIIAPNGILGKRFGGFVALENINVTVEAGERLGLIGPNGSGKSTLVNCLSGTLHHDSGSVVFDRRRIDGMPAYQRTRLGLARSFQLPKPFRSLNLVDNLRIPLLYTVNARHGAHLSGAAIDERSRALLADVGLADKATRLPRDLTQVEMRKLELARAVASAPRLLFADETMAGLSPSEVEEILIVLFRLNEQGITIVLIEHIMRAVMSFSTRLVVLVAGQKIADGAPQEAIRNPEVERAYLGE